MKLIIQLGEKYAEIFNVFFRKSRIKSVIGEILLLDYLQAFIPNGINFHSHFIYFENGDYHFSIKYYDTVENLYVDRKTYHNHIATRKSRMPDFKKEDEVSYERRDKIPNDLLDMFMRAQPSQPWSEKPLSHHFSTFSMHADGDYAEKFNWKDDIKINKDDLVVNFRDYKDHTINFNAIIYNKGNPAFDMKEAHIDPAYIEKTIESDDLIVKFSMVTTFNPIE